MYFIALQGTYSSIELGLFKENSTIATKFYDELRASSNLVLFIEKFLKKHAVLIDNLAFIAVDKGPGAFTSLRATIASVNGIGYAKKIPLIGINSLEALQVQAASQDQSESVRYSASLLNAYNSDVYFRIYDQQQDCLVDESCQKINILVQRLVDFQNPVLCLGNGALVYKQELTDSLGTALKVLSPNPAVPNVESIAMIAREIYAKPDFDQNQYAIEPYYLKTQLFAIKR